MICMILDWMINKKSSACESRGFFLLFFQNLFLNYFFHFKNDAFVYFYTHISK